MKNWENDLQLSVGDEIYRFSIDTRGTFRVDKAVIEYIRESPRRMFLSYVDRKEKSFPIKQRFGFVYNNSGTFYVWLPVMDKQEAASIFYYKVSEALKSNKALINDIESQNLRLQGQLEGLNEYI